MVATAKTPVEHTVTQKVLLAAHTLEQAGHTPFSAEALIVACWQANPRTFGLKGFHETYPDSNRVLSCIMGERGLARQGWLAKVGVKLYTLSDRGRREVNRLEKVADGDHSIPIEKPKAKMGRDVEKFVLRVIGSAAVLRYRTGSKHAITFRDACEFWGAADPTDVVAVRKAALRLSDDLTNADGHMKNDRLDLSNGRLVSKDELKTVAGVHAFLMELFARQLDPSRVRR